MGLDFMEYCGFVNPQMKLISGIDYEGLSNTLSTGICWTDFDHTPPPHSSHSGSPANCWSYAAVRAFKNKYKQYFRACDPTIDTGVDAFDDDYFNSFAYNPSWVAEGDVVGTGIGGTSHAAFVYEVPYPSPTDETIRIVDSNRISGQGERSSTLAQMEADRYEQVTMIHRPKNLVLPPSTSPTLVSPDSGSYFIGTTQTLDWSGGFLRYILWVDTDSSFSSPEIKTVTSSSYQFTFARGQTHCWQVRGCNDCAPGPFSPYRWLHIKSDATYAMTFGYHGPYTLGGHTVHKIAVTFRDGSLRDLSYINIYKKLGSGTWQFLESKSAYLLPYTYEGPEINMYDNVPLKSGTKIYYKGVYYSSSGQFISGENWDYCLDLF
jgi:hypothetical protein